MLTVAKAIVSAVIAALSVLAGLTQAGSITVHGIILAALAFFVAFNAVYFTKNAGTVTMADLQKQVSAMSATVNTLAGGAK